MDFRAGAVQACETIGRLVEELNTNIALYDAAERASLYQNEGDAVDKHVLDLFLADFRLSGVHLRHDPARRDSFLNAASEAIHLSSKFSQVLTLNIYIYIVKLVNTIF
ncbi:unnamed protein product [Protopolystoma xenopodis]|uniref:Uncharacterized protein n=1 Tax=Protopolystoma xenopodis TaxID=117903 RepID=A0A448WEA7_9PLAT|nr:unnamed protein product [Protopolystoma xenopodis]